MIVNSLRYPPSSIDSQIDTVHEDATERVAQEFHKRIDYDSSQSNRGNGQARDGPEARQDSIPHSL